MNRTVTPTGKSAKTKANEKSGTFDFPDFDDKSLQENISKECKVITFKSQKEIMYNKIISHVINHTKTF